MAGRRRQTSFRPAAEQARSNAPNRRQALALAVALVLVAGAIGFASYLVKPGKARTFSLYYGNVFLNDDTAPVAVDLASGKPTVRLSNAYQQVSAKVSGDLDVVPLVNGTLLLNSVNGEFNMLDDTGFAVKTTGGGVSLPDAAAGTAATGIADGSSAYIVRNTATGTSVFLVNQATVSSAADSARTSARATATVPLSEDASTTATAANGALWMLTGTGSSRNITELSVPANSRPGATMKMSRHGVVAGPAAAVSSTTLDADGSGAQSVAIASAGAIRVFDGKTGTTIPVHGLSAADRILPTSEQHGGFDFLYRSAGGWHLVSVAADGSGTADVTGLGAIGGGDLAAPTQSDGYLYTMSLGTSGDLWRISPGGIAEALPGQNHYPLVSGEPAEIATAEVFARGSRVLFNSRTHLDALTYFADGSHAPVVVDKQVAVNVDAAGAAALTAAHSIGDTKQQGKQPTPKGSKSTPPQGVNNTINCKATTQVPRIPLVDQVSAGSRSVQLAWGYPPLGRDGCAPSTYTVTVKLLSGNAPPAPATVTVQGQSAVNLTGLYPNTRYGLIVTAYINGRGTPSREVDVQTQPEGPPAPFGVHVGTDSTGNWTLSWHYCASVAKNCVPPASWQIIPQVCDNASGLVTDLTVAKPTADPSTDVAQYVYQGNGGLLGRSLSFQIEGVASFGTVGSPGKSGCARSWANPIATDLTLHASSPPQTQVSGTSHTTATVAFTGSPAVAMGGYGATLTYVLICNGQTVDQLGPTASTSASLSGIPPDTTCSVRLTVAPPGHPNAAVTVSTPVEQATSQWPTIGVGSSFTDTDDSNGTLNVSISNISSAHSGGETFDLYNSSLQCGNTAMSLSRSGFDPAAGTLSFTNIPRQNYNGSCSVTVQLVEHGLGAGSAGYYGGSRSPIASANLNIDVPTLPTSTSDFGASIQGNLGLAPQVNAFYQGNSANGQLLGQYATGWTEQTQYSTDGGNTWQNCPGANDTQNLANGTSHMNLSSNCYYNATWQVKIGFNYFGQSANYVASVNATGPGPIGLTASDFAASWEPNVDNQGNVIADLQYTGPNYNDNQASNWSEVLTCGGAQVGPTQNESPEDAPQNTINFPTPAPSTAYSGCTITVSYSDAAIPNTVQTVTVAVSGSSPTASPPSSPPTS